MRRFDEIVSDIPMKTKCVDDAYYGETILKRASSKHAIGLKLAEIMESRLTLRSLFLLRTVLNLLASK